MNLLDTATLTHDNILPDASANLQVYCSLDSCVALEAFGAINRELGPPPQIYSFTRAMQGPYLEMMGRGFRVDEIARRNAAAGLRVRIEALTDRLNRICAPLLDGPLIGPGKKLPHFSVLQELFYRRMHIPEVWLSQKGERKLSTNREALEKIEEYAYAAPIVALILLIRDLYKQLQVFEEDIDPDLRHRSSYNITGTETGRPSSSENAFGTGGNAQNIAPSLRYVFIADRGMKMGVVDLEQVEARDVGFICGCLFGDWSYLDACESGDLHTTNAALIWPEWNWPSAPAARRHLAEETKVYRDYSARDMAKRGGHLSNYSGTAYTAARSLRVEQSFMDDFQARYVRGRPERVVRGRHEPAIEPAFGCIARYWQWIAQELQTKRSLTNLFGRKRDFFGRSNDAATHREAIAFLPQSTTADRMNLGLWRCWRHMPQIQVLAQTYDSITFQYSESANEEAIIEEVLERVRVELRSPREGRTYVVPGEAKVGWNWGNYDPRVNTEGLKKYKRGVPDNRVRALGWDRLVSTARSAEEGVQNAT
jgi:DNA polymerase I-like protein with 3'-5' exonuclease and polymerase domains